MIDVDAFRIGIAVQAVSHGPAYALARGRLACLRCDCHVVTWASQTPPTLGELDRAADFHAGECRPVT